MRKLQLKDDALVPYLLCHARNMRESVRSQIKGGIRSAVVSAYTLSRLKLTDPPSEIGEEHIVDISVFSDDVFRYRKKVSFASTDTEYQAELSKIKILVTGEIMLVSLDDTGKEDEEDSLDDLSTDELFSLLGFMETSLHYAKAENEGWSDGLK